MAIDLPRRLTAEALGTAMLLATIVGSGIMAQSLTGDTALALLANTVATGAILVVLITMLGPISGAHFNPAVSFVFVLRRKLSIRDAGFYAVVQVAGGIVGTIAAHLMFALPLAANIQQNQNRRGAVVFRRRGNVWPRRRHLGGAAV